MSSCVRIDESGRVNSNSWLPRLTWHSASFNSFASISLKLKKRASTRPSHYAALAITPTPHRPQFQLRAAVPLRHELRAERDLANLELVPVAS